MKVTVYLSDGGSLDADFDAESVMDLRDDVANGSERFLTFDLDGATVVVNRDHIVRVDFETGGD